MKKNNKLLILSLICCTSMGGCFGSSNSNSSGTGTSSSITNVTIVEFDVNEERVDLADVGSKYSVKPVSAKDSAGKYYMATIKVVDPKGAEVTLTNNEFVCDKLGQYVITYTVTYGNNQTVSKSYKVDVTDVSTPEVVTDLSEHCIATVGTEFDLNQFSVKDNSGENITPNVSVSFNGTDITDSVVDNKFTLTEKGCYVVKITAEDSSENALLQEYYIHTLMDFENGYYFNNQFYATEITNDHAFKGEASYSFGAFDGHASWFNDYSMLGNVQILDKEAQYLSFWIKFEEPTYATVMKAIYFDTKAYDVYGDELPEYFQGGYEFIGGNWYKIVVDLTNVVNTGEAQDINDATPNPDTLERIPFYFGAWDSVNQTNASISQKVFLDNIQLTNDPSADSDLEEKPLPPETDYVPGIETALDYEFGIYGKVKASEDGWVKEHSLADYTLARGTYLEYEPLRPNDEGTLGDKSNNKAYAENWRFITRHNDGIVYVVKAKEHSFVKFTEPDNLAGWIEGNNITIAKYTALTNEYTELKNVAASKGQFNCDYQELEAGDILFLQVKFEWADERNIQFPSGISLATALEKGQTIKLDAPTNVAVTSGAGKYKVTFDNVQSATSYLGYIYNSNNEVLTDYDGFAIVSGQELDLSSLTEGTYSIRVKAVGTGVFTDSELSSSAEFTVSNTTVVSLEDVRTYLKDSTNATNIASIVKDGINGTTSETVKYGIRNGTEELPTNPCDANGWSGFVENGPGFRVQFIGSKADNYYYSYTASEAGYVYLTDRMASWYDNSATAEITATVGNDVVYTNSIDQIVLDGSTENKMAVYLEAGETLTVTVTLSQLAEGVTFSYETINVSFYPLSEELELPSGYNSLNEYFA